MKKVYIPIINLIVAIFVILIFAPLFFFCNWLLRICMNEKADLIEIQLFKDWILLFVDWRNTLSQIFSDELYFK